RGWSRSCRDRLTFGGAPLCACRRQQQLSMDRVAPQEAVAELGWYGVTRGAFDPLAAAADAAPRVGLASCTLKCRGKPRADERQQVRNAVLDRVESGLGAAARLRRFRQLGAQLGLQRQQWRAVTEQLEVRAAGQQRVVLAL